MEKHSLSRRFELAIYRIRILVPWRGSGPLIAVA